MASRSPSEGAAKLSGEPASDSAPASKKPKLIPLPEYIPRVNEDCYVQPGEARSWPGAEEVDDSLDWVGKVLQVNNKTWKVQLQWYCRFSELPEALQQQFGDEPPHSRTVFLTEIKNWVHVEACLGPATVLGPYEYGVLDYAGKGWTPDERFLHCPQK